MQATSAAEALAYLERRLAELVAAQQGYRVQIHGKGRAITVEITEIARFDGQPAPPAPPRAGAEG